MSGRPSTAETLAQITAPTLILKADAPPERRKANEEAAKALKNGKLVHIDGAGHNVRREQFEKYVAAVTAFLETVA